AAGVAAPLTNGASFSQAVGGVDAGAGFTEVRFGGLRSAGGGFGASLGARNPRGGVFANERIRRPSTGTRRAGRKEAFNPLSLNPFENRRNSNFRFLQPTNRTLNEGR
ncbi:MAG: hypothetical protein AAF360_15015, partial [Pseudomonadota bacterium]